MTPTNTGKQTGHTRAYRAKKIGDAEYLAGRKAFIEADREHDAKEEAYILAVNALVDTDPTPGPSSLKQNWNNYRRYNR